MEYSILMSVYNNEKVEYFVQSIESLLNQTVPPNQIVLVRDGKVYKELQETIDKYVNENPSVFTYLPLEENGGLGNALRYGLSHCKNELVGRMDTDDISLPNRFELQLEFMKNNPEIDVLSGNISEFSESPNDIIDYRVVPQAHEEIVDYLKTRSPFNHMAVMFKKSSLEKVNSYESFYLFEDWYLWVKMYLAGAKFANLNEVLVNARISSMSERRGGIKYYRSCVKLLKFMKKNKVIGYGKYIKTCMVRFVAYVLLPNKLRGFLYKKLARKKIEE